MAAKTSLNTFQVNQGGVLVQDFANFPPTLTILNLYGSNFAPSASDGSNIGFDIDGNVAWSEIFQRFSLSQFGVRYSNLRGSLPDSLPSTMRMFELTSAQMSGTIPASFFSNIFASTGTNPTINILASGNQFTGGIPSTLFNGFPLGKFSMINFNFAYSSLTGTIPADLFQPLNGALLVSFGFNVAGSQLTGPIPGDLFPNNILSTVSSDFTFNMRSNNLSGTFPAQLFAAITGFRSFKLDISNGRIGFTGTLPPRLFPNGWSPSAVGVLSIDLSSSGFSGTIPSTFFTGGLTASVVYSELSLYMNLNQFTGTLPGNLLYTDGTTKRELSSASLSGSLERRNSSLALESSSDASSSSTDTSDASSAINSIAGTRYYLDFSRNLLEGPLPSTFYSNWNSAGAYTGTFSVSYNYLNGSIPSSMVNVPALQSFTAASNYFDGTMPSVVSTLSYLDLRSTDVEFCTSPVALKSVCSLPIGACSCQSIYPNCGFYCTGAPPPPPITPPEEPIEPITPPITADEPIPISTPVDVPIDVPITPIKTPVSTEPTSALCPNKTRPSEDFLCADGIWTANSTQGPTLVIPSDAGKVIVLQSLSSSAIYFTGTNASIELEGSAPNLTHVTIELSPSETEEIHGKQILLTLITTNSSGSAGDGSLINLGTVNVGARATSGCRKPEAKRAVFDGGRTLGAYLTVSNSACNRWWIILVAVVVSLIVVILIVLILLTVFYKPFRVLVRPFVARNAKSANDNNLK